MDGSSRPVHSRLCASCCYSYLYFYRHPFIDHAAKFPYQQAASFILQLPVKAGQWFGQVDLLLLVLFYTPAAMVSLMAALVGADTGCCCC
jgi:hypothetical protein